MEVGGGNVRTDPIKANDRFYYTISVSAVRPVDTVGIIISMPQEVGVNKVVVERVAGGKTIAREERNVVSDKEIKWTGDLRPRADEKGKWAEQTQIITLFLVSRADGRRWTAPIEATVDIDYTPLPYRRGGGLADWKAGHYRRIFTKTYKDWLSTDPGRQ